MTRDDVEIDLIIERPGMPIALVEIKSSENIRDEHIKSLETLGREIPNSERFCLSRDPVNRIKNGIHVLNWEHGIEELGLGMALTTTAGCERND